jgi:hypothetical protein
VVILGSKHSGKRSLVDTLIDISKTTLYGKRMQSGEGNKMRMKGLTTAIDYAYLNVLDSTDPDNRSHSFTQAPTPNSKCTWWRKSSTPPSTASWLRPPC